jgi:hypothetical protein
MKLKYFFSNKNLLFLIIFLLTKDLGYNTIDAINEPYLLQILQFPRENIATIKFFLIPLDIFSVILATKIASFKKEFTLLLILCPFKVLNNVYTYWILKTYDGVVDNYYSSIMINYGIDCIIVTMIFVSIGAFFLRQCDVDYGASYLIFLSSFANLGRLWSRWLCLNLIMPIGLDI